MIFCSLMGDAVPEIIIPSLSPGSSSNIKVWGLESTFKFRVVILNKDTNSSASGEVNIQAMATSSTKMKCVYLRAPSLTSKAPDMSIGGYQYNADSSVPTGTFEQIEYSYSEDIMGYKVPIKYAEACHCELPNPNIIIPQTD